MTSTREEDEKKMEPAQVAKTFERQWVKIGDVEYDVTDMKHPGGSVIYYMLSNVGADATEAFREFHYRSRKAEKMLKCLPHRKYDANSHYSSSKYNNNNMFLIILLILSNSICSIYNIIDLFF